MTTTAVAVPATRQDRGDTLGTALLVAVGRALALMLLVVVLATAASGPLAGLTPASSEGAADGAAVVVDPLDERPGQAQDKSWRD